MSRPDGRKSNALRPVRIERGVLREVPGSVIFRAGRTHVLCTACVEEGVPDWRAGRGLGWLTAEYDMLPASTGRRRPRNRAGNLDGRTQEIQRLIGRSLRGVVDFARLGERTVWIDCDVVQADGGTRTAAVTGAYVALCDALDSVRAAGGIAADPMRGQVAAVSVGRVGDRSLLDLCYDEDAKADVDFNVVMTDAGRFVEVQGTAEGAAFGRREMDAMLRLAERGIRELMAIQRRALGRRGRGGRG